MEALHMIESNLDEKPQPDPRSGCTSGSNALADSLCPGRHLAQQQWGERERENDDTMRGKRGHVAVAEEDPEMLLDESEASAADRVLQLRAKRIEEWEEKYSISSWGTVKEQRLWLYDDAGDRLHSGQPDEVVMGYTASGEAHCLVLDAKMLQGGNTAWEQLYDYAALVAVAHQSGEIQSYSIAFLKPWVADVDQDKEVRWGLDEAFMQEHLRRMFDRAYKSQMRGAYADTRPKRTPNTVSCRYCRAWHRCPEAQKHTKEKMNALDKQVELAPKDEEALFEWLDCIQPRIDDWKKAFKAKLQANPGNYQTFAIETSPGNRTVVDKGKLITQMTSAGVPISDVVDIAKIPVGKAETLFADKWSEEGHGTKAEGRMEFNDLMQANGAIGRGKDRTSIVRKTTPPAIHFIEGNGSKGDY